MRVRRFSQAMLLLGAASLIASAPALAQFSPSYKFLESVRKQEAEEVNDAIGQPGSTIINTRDSTTGETALHIVITRRDAGWLAFLLAKGADPNIGNNHGVTPLELATNLGFGDGVTLLAEHGARLDEPDQEGETPLIDAVHRHDVAIMHTLLTAGANPDRADNSGRSARDYAALDGPDSPMLAEIRTNARPASNGAAGGHTYGPKL